VGGPKIDQPGARGQAQRKNIKIFTLSAAEVFLRKLISSERMMVAQSKNEWTTA
jgi:hypothetical protein